MTLQTSLKRLFDNGKMPVRLYLKARSRCQIHSKPVAAALVAAGHFGGCMAEMFLNVALVDLGGAGQTGA